MRYLLCLGLLACSNPTATKQTPTPESECLSSGGQWVILRYETYVDANGYVRQRAIWGCLYGD